MVIGDLASFKEGVSKLGFDDFWSLFIQTYLHETRPDLETAPSEMTIDLTNDIFSLDNIGELYEIALEHTNQISKKELGQYYTPKDVCTFMAKKVTELQRDNNLADVCCGTGNLIIAVLSQLDSDTVVDLIRQKKIYLYDLDRHALRLALMKICILFVPKNDLAIYQNIDEHISTFVGNFMDDETNLPAHTVVISNPPYGKLPPSMPVWRQAETLKTNDMYGVFIEKIAKQAEKSVIISPQSFLGSTKFASLRKVLSAYGGSIWAFDNVPAGLFCGRKKGIFNSNTANSVRAAITVIDKEQSGFRVSPMIRFRAEERTTMFSLIDKMLGETRYDDARIWTKIPRTLEPLVADIDATKRRVADLISADETDFKITVPSTPRYFITGTKRELSRSSKIELFARDQTAFDSLYLVLNSSLSYLWWRINDGGITLTKQTLLSLPVPNLDRDEARQLALEGIKLEATHLVNKLNAGKNNQNVKFPEGYRRRINHLFLQQLGHEKQAEALLSIHANNIASARQYWI